MSTENVSAVFDIALQQGASEAEAAEIEARYVFGSDYKRDRNGKPIEQGVGSAANPSLNHFMALKKAEMAGVEAVGSYDRAVAALWKTDPARARKIGLPRAKV
jgi:hypothetical protein